ncbi:MAG: peptidase M23 [Alphaproteobacteria bacterium]|nr:peptidase M23 [Alphaproteobacteria bacterium]
MRRTSARLVVTLAALAALLPVVAPLSAQEARPTLQEVERELEASRERERVLAAEAEAQIREIERLRVQSAAAALSVQDSEATLTAVESRLAGLSAEEAAKSAELERRRGELGALLTALQRLARHPPEALALLPERPIDTLRTARLLGAVVPPIEAEAAALAREVESLSELRASVAAERAALAEATQRLAGNRERLRGLTAQRARFVLETEAARQAAGERSQALARQAEDLRDLLRKLAETKAAEERAAGQRSTLQARVTEGLAGRLRRLGEARGQMAMPVRGRVVQAYGQAGEGGQPHRGLSLEVRADAQVVAPFDGQIVFAGPFRGYGRILIIEHGEGYHTLLAGLGRIDVSPGQVVALGEPIATTGNADPGGPATSGAAGPVLYVELRRHGQPINPTPWLAASDGKVSG